MLTIGIIDRHPILRTGLGLVLKNVFTDFRVLESPTIAAFNENYPHDSPVLFIIGSIGTTVKHPLAFIGQLKKWYKDGKIIIYEEEQLDVVDFLLAGVNGYISKQASISELVTCVQEVLEGKTYLNHDVTLELLMGFGSHSSGLARGTQRPIDGYLPSLTPREREIATYLSDGMGTSTIAQNLGRKSSTISTIKKNIYRKLSISNIVELRMLMGFEKQDEVPVRKKEKSSE